MGGCANYRWRAVVRYRADHGPVEVEYDIEELDELPDLIERGPDWNCVIAITITLARVSTPGLTLERAAEQ